MRACLHEMSVLGPGRHERLQPHTYIDDAAHSPHDFVNVHARSIAQMFGPGLALQ